MEYNPADDQWISPLRRRSRQRWGSDGRPPRAAVPHVAFDKRVLRQTFEYDWLGNTDRSGDDARGFYDRSLGTIENATTGTPGVTEAKPYQLRSASNIEGAADGREGQLWTKYDVAGNLTRLDLRRVGPCLPSGDCSQRFEYRWDEVGRLERARRWDTSTDLGAVDGAVPASTPVADLRYVYDASDQRILKEAVDSAGVSSHTVYLFPTLELRRAAYGDGLGYDGSPEGVADYEVDRWTAVPYLLANGVRLARLAFEETTAPSRDPAEMTGEDGAVNASTSQLHVFFELGDHLGSTSVVLDKATGELVERNTFLGYGATESDYRPTRWEGFREDYKFTGKEEDVEVGLQYFGKRFLSPHLGRWVSADPLAVHAPGEADLNLYAYVSSQLLKVIDWLGLDKVMIVVGNAPSDSDDADLKQFAHQWVESQHEKLRDGTIIRAELDAGERHVVAVNSKADANEMTAAMQRASELAGKGGEVILAIGHGAASEGRKSGFVDLAPNAKGTRLRLTAEALEFAETARTGQGIAKISDAETAGTELLSAWGEALRAEGVQTLELLTCRVGADDSAFVENIASRTGVRVEAHKLQVGVRGGHQASVMLMNDKDTPVKGTESTTMTPAPTKVVDPGSGAEE